MSEIPTAIETEVIETLANDRNDAAQFTLDLDAMIELSKGLMFHDAAYADVRWDVVRAGVFEQTPWAR